ncbi:MAG TPA: MotA/TolQ/ExbB proton channel family protein [Candidatus Polarisedimenticolia bacterium]|nr:MotA/TolQ/ExbB proton channel family protein [Candidatus Polarisedimenticolia bacterium]
MPLGSILYLATAGPGSQGDFLRLIADSGALVKLVLLILLGFSVLSWAVIFERARTLKRAERDSLAFLSDLEAERRLVDLRDRAGRYGASPLAAIFVAGFREMTSAISEGISRFRGSPSLPEEARVRILERVRRRLEEIGAAEAEKLDRNLSLLAITASVTPFIGLFGTVWGIMNAFQGIAVTGSASLPAVAPGISEALVTTAFGLFAAIPAVIGYNLLLARARRLAGRIERFVLTFGSLAEAQIEAGRGTAPVEAGKAHL